MNLIHKSFRGDSLTGDWVIIIGNFDGFHLGHQALIKQLLIDSQQLKAKSAVLTFDPHPKKVLQPQVPFYQIYDNESKCRFLDEAGLDSCFVIPFTIEFSSLGPDEFINKLFSFINLKKILVGYDFNFGKGRQGSAVQIKKEAEMRGIAFEQSKPVKAGGITISSTMIRRLLFEGDFKMVQKLLGREWMISGTVVHDQGRGKELGFPTINLNPALLYPLRFGVYACMVEVDGKRFKAIGNFGLRPTFGWGSFTIEAHILDDVNDLYNKRVGIIPVNFIRDEVAFQNTHELTSQIKKDIGIAQEILSKL